MFDFCAQLLKIQLFKKVFSVKPSIVEFRNYIIPINTSHMLIKLLLPVLPLGRTMLSQFMLALSLFVWLTAPLILPCTVRPTWFYLCHHIRLSGGKSLLMTQRLLALCFGLPVNAGHANGISPHKPALSVYNNCCILLLSTRISKHNTTSLCCFTQWHCGALVL